MTVNGERQCKERWKEWRCDGGRQRRKMERGRRRQREGRKEEVWRDEDEREGKAGVYAYKK